MPRFIQYGDLVYIEISEALLCSNGFQSPNIYLVSGLNLKSNRHCLFQFSPLLEDQDPLNNDPKIRAQNLQKLKETHGKPINFTDKFLLLHAESKMFLQSHNSGDAQNTNTTFTLSHRISSSSQFTASANDNSSSEKMEYDSGLKLTSVLLSKELQKGTYIKTRPELNPSINTLTNSTNDFPSVPPRRLEPVWDMSSVYNVGIDVSSKPQNCFVRLFCAKNFLEHVRSTGLIVNGDYIRLSHEGSYLHYYQNRTERLLYFQSQRLKEYAYSYAATAWQLVQVPNLPTLPLGQVTWTNTFEQETDAELKKYVIRHFVTGEYLVFSEGQITCKPLTGISDSTSFVEVFRKEFKPLITGSTISLRFKDQTESRYLTRSDAVGVKISQFEMNTVYFFGFKWTEEYLTKIIHIERFQLKGTANHEPDASNLRVEVITPDEVLSLNETESLVNSLQRFLDYLYDLSNQGENILTSLNQEISKLKELIKEYNARLYYIHESVTHLVSAKTACFIKQNLLREFRFFDLANRIFYNFVRAPFVQNKINEARTKAAADEKEDFNEISLLELLEALADLIFSAAEGNRLNYFYQAQFVRIYIHCLFNAHVAGTLKTSPHLQRSHACFKKLIFEFLWDHDLDGLGQLNYYKDPIFNAITNDEVYCSAHLEVLTHFMSSKALNLKNQVKEHILANVIGDETQTNHIFPSIKLNESAIVVEFKRTKKTEADKTVPLEEFNGEEANFDDQTKAKLVYLQRSLELFISISSPEDYRYYHFAMNKYPMATLEAALGLTKNLKLQTLISEIIVAVYNRYFSYLKKNIPREIHSEIELKKGDLEVWGEEKELLKEKGFDVDSLANLGLEDNTLLLKNWNNFIETYSIENHELIFIDLIEKLQQWSPQQFKVVLKPAFKGVQSILKRLYEKDSANLDFKLLARTLALKNTLLKEISKEAAFDIFGTIRAKGISNGTLEQAVIQPSFLSQIEGWKSYEKLEDLGGANDGLPYTSPTNFFQNSVDFIIKQQDPSVTKEVLVNLIPECDFETQVKHELISLVPLAEDRSIETVEKVIVIHNVLKDGKRALTLKRDVSTLQGKEIFDNHYNSVLNNLEMLLTAIYDTRVHLKEPVDNSDITDEKFLKVFRAEKVVNWDKVLKVNEKAILKPFQKILRHLGVHDTLLDLVGIFLKLKTAWTPDIMTVYARIIRLCFFILTVFVYKNPDNQLALASRHSFILNYYDQNYINQGADCMILFAEVMRDNDFLLSVPYKFLFDISWYTFIGTLKRQVSNTESNSYLCAALMSLQYLLKLDIPIGFLDPVQIYTAKLNEICNGEFNNMNLKTMNDSANVDESGTRTLISPFGYYTIRELLNSVSDLLPYFAKTESVFKSLQKEVTVDKWTKRLGDPQLLYQFEIRTAALRVIQALHFSRKQTDIKFITTAEQFKNFMAIFITDLAAFAEYKKKEEKVHESLNSNLLSNLEGDSVIQQLKTLWAQQLDFLALPLAQIYQRVHVDDVPLRILWNEYITEGLIEITSALIDAYPEFAKEKLFTNNSEISSFVDLYIYYLNFVLTTNDREVSQRASNLLQKLTNNGALAESNSAFLDLTSKATLVSAKSIKISKKSTLADEFEDSVQRNIEKGEISAEKNVERLAKIISGHEKSDLVIDEIIKGAKHEHYRMSTSELQFVGKVLIKSGHFAYGFEEEQKGEAEDQKVKQSKLTDRKRYFELSNIFTQSKDSKQVIKTLIKAPELFAKDVKEEDIWNDEQAKKEDD